MPIISGFKLKYSILVNRWVVLFLLALWLKPNPLISQVQSKAPKWDGWQFLVGKWEGKGSGAPGEGTGGFTFQFDLQNRVLLRKNYAEYPATKDRPAFRHDDLMVVYQTDDGSTRADYYDNEGHVIHYDTEISADSSSIMFISGITPGSPRYRLTYSKELNGSLGIRFEVAPPDKPGEFVKYIDATAERAVKGESK